MRGRLVTWSGGKIQPGEVGKFSFSAHMPETPGTSARLPVARHYANGEVVHWIGAETSDNAGSPG